MTSEFESFLKNRWPLAAGLVLVLFIVGAGVVGWKHRQNNIEQKTRDDLYQALSVLKQDEALVKDKKFSSLSDFQQAYAKGFESLQKVAKSAPGTRSAFEAELKLGDLYGKHGFAAEALPFFNSAATHAPQTLDRVLALISVGYTQEKLQKWSEAVSTFEKALSLGEASMQGELMLSVARVKARAGDLAGAKAVYEKIMKTLPNTEYAKTAETLQNQ